MDGTGILFSLLIDLLPAFVQAKIVTYSTAEKQTYDELIQEIKLKLPVVPFILLAESFAGPIAHELSLDKNIPIEKVILVASFLSSPRPKLSGIAELAPLKIFLSLQMPRAFIRYFCFGQYVDNKLVSLFRKAIERVDKGVLTFRLLQIARLKAPENISNTTCINFIATNDKLVPRRVGKKIENHFDQVTTIELEVPHFLAQTNNSQIILSIIQG